MIEKIYIPTLGRAGKQKTYLNLPEKLKKITTLVVREEEANLHGDLPITVIDKPVKNVAETRQWIAYYAGVTRYAVLDDDLGFKIRFRDIWKHREGDPRHFEQVEAEWYKYYDMEDKDFDDLFNMVDNWFDTGITWAGLRMSSLACPPHPVTENSNCHGAMFYNGELLPTKKIDWTRYENSVD